jgi:hypothetical protein
MNRIGQTTAPQSPFGKEQLRDLPAVRVIPYDYVAEFTLRGDVGNLIQDVINISVEGVFVAVSIGYGVDEERTEDLALIRIDPNPANQPTLGNITLDNISPDVLLEGFRIKPDFASVAVQNGQLNANLPFSVASNIFERVKPSENFGFMLSIVDSATGRELQNEPVHSVATLGRANGQRPFKMLSQPMVFMPRSTIRLQVEERTAGVKGKLFVTLQGYKVLGVAGMLEEEVRRLVALNPLKKVPVYDYETGNYRTLGEALQHDLPTASIVPFDYVSTLDLKGKPGNIEEDEVPVNVDGGYITTALGYSLDVSDTSIQIVPTGELSDVEGNLRTIALKDIRPAEALLDGIRIHPLRVRFAFTSTGQLSVVPKDMVGRMLQRLNQPDEVKFLYSIIDTGTGRELQNQLVFNIAGLGIANGERPFRVLHKPMMFLPRSTIRVQVKEIFGRGRLFIVFQGYKMLN